MHLQNPLNLDDVALDLLRQDFDRYEPYAEGLSATILRYLVDGDREEEAREAMSSLDPRRQPALFYSQQLVFARFEDAHNARSQFWKLGSIDNASFYYRLAKIYDWEMGIYAWLGAPIFRDTAAWMNALLYTIAGNIVPLRGVRLLADPKHECTKLTASMLAAILEMGGESPDTLARTFYLATDPQNTAIVQEWLEEAIADFSDYSLAHREIVRAALSSPQRERRLVALEVMAAGQVAIAPFADLLVNAAIGSAKLERELAGKLLAKDVPAVRALLETKAHGGKSEERLHAVHWLWELAGEAARGFLESCLVGEKAEKVRAALQMRLVVSENPRSKADATPEPDFVDPLSPGAIAALTELLASCLPSDRKQELAHPALQEAIAQGTVADCRKIGNLLRLAAGFPPDRDPSFVLELLPTQADFSLLHLVRLALVADVRVDFADLRFYYGCDAMGKFVQALRAYSSKQGRDFTLPALARVYELLGLKADALGLIILHRPTSQDCWFAWMTEAFIADYFAERQHLLIEAIAPTTKLYAFEKEPLREAAYAEIARLKELPAPLIGKLWEVALGAAKTLRSAAQDCLERLPDTRDRVIALLQDKKQEHRIAAAEWLARLHARDAVPAIQTALEGEKQPAAKDALARSLRALGVTVTTTVDKAALLQEATKGLQKGIPEALAWFPFAELPTVRWRDTEATVAPDILIWLIVRSYKQKTPEPSPLLCEQVASFHLGDRRQLGQFAIEHWLARDTTLPTPEEAKAIAWRMLESLYGMQATSTKPDDDIPDWAMSMALQRPKTSAIKEKGILAIAGACGDATIATAVGKYLTTWYGQRSGQCIALIQMLGWIEENSAIQLLLSVANRFRTRSIQQEAAKVIDRLAERQGWSRDELADRTIPTAGLSETSELVLDYGKRQFTARLDEKLQLAIVTGEGKVLKSLPEPHQDEVAASVKDAKQQFAIAKKELKQVLALQRDRLYEAMCVQRAWHFDDWDRLLHRHPIVRFYCQRLIWAVFAGDRPVQTFRPLGDGSLSDAHNAEVTVAADGEVRLAHAFYLDKVTMQQWREHLIDYEIIPLFDRVLMEPYHLPHELLEAEALVDFQGFMTESFTLRGLAAKFGYTRGSAYDGGWFYEYHKDFAGRQIRATLEFSGNPLPEENRPVALTRIVFSRIPPDALLPLREIPSVLLSEVWHDMKAIADRGSGYDAEWERKVM